MCLPAGDFHDLRGKEKDLVWVSFSTFPGDFSLLTQHLNFSLGIHPSLDLTSCG